MVSCAWVALLLLALFYDRASAQSGTYSTSCNCNFGNVDLYTPQCVCSCFDGYLLPRCLYRATDIVPVEIWLKVAPKDFYSNELLQTLSWALPANISQLQFLYVHPFPQFNKTAAYIAMKGDRAQQLVWDVQSQNPWTLSANIEASWERVAPQPASTTYGAALAVYESSDGKILITVEGIMWLIAAIVVAVTLTCFDYIALQNEEDIVIEHMVDNHPAMTDLVNGRAIHHTTVEEDNAEAAKNPLKRPTTAQGTSASSKAVASLNYTNKSDDPRRLFTDKSRK